MIPQTVTITRRQFSEYLGDLDEETKSGLWDRLKSWPGGEVCDRVRLTLDGDGSIHLNSNPRPA